MSTAENITEKKLFANARVFIAPTKAKDVVTIVGSVLGGENMLPRTQSGVPMLAGSLFDAGTKRTAKDILRESLAARGATLSFSTGIDRTYFYASCLPEDLQFLLDMIVECLGEALFLEKEIPSVRERLLGGIEESKTDTHMQASNELSRLLYDEQHVNYADKDSVTEKSLRAATRAQLLGFRTLLGTGGLVLAIVGDTDSTTALKAIEKSFGKMSEGTLEESKKSKNKKVASAQEKRIVIHDKANVDVFLGAVIPLTINDTLYLPFTVMSDMLGGGFAAHLMQTVRERDGLTYGISTSLSGFGKDVEGAFRIWSTFSPDLFDKVLQTIHKEIKSFSATGITKSVLEKKHDEMTGSYTISLATTRGLASMLHKIGVEGKSLSYIDEYPNLIRAVTVKDVQGAAQLIPRTKLSLAAAGTFAK